MPENEGGGYVPPELTLMTENDSSTPEEEGGERTPLGRRIMNGLAERAKKIHPLAVALPAGALAAAATYLPTHEIMQAVAEQSSASASFNAITPGILPAGVGALAFMGVAYSIDKLQQRIRDLRQEREELARGGSHA